MKAGRLAVCFITHDDAYYLAESITSFAHGGEVFVFVSRVPWHDQPGDWRKAMGVGRLAGAEVVEGEWRSELEHRQAACAYLLEKGFTHALIPDGDEIIESTLLANLVKIAKAGLADRVYVHWDTYWKSPEYVIRPREGFTPLAMVDLRAAKPVGLRNFEGGRPLLLGPEHGIVHHLSYVGPDARIQRKIATWGHADEVIPGWYENVWLGWDSNKLLRDLHPTHAQAYGFAERIAVPEALLGASDRLSVIGDQSGGSDRSSVISDQSSVIGDRSETRPERLNARTPERPVPELPRCWGVNVVIPLCGGTEIGECLESLLRCADLIISVIVVDNGSPPETLKIVEEYVHKHSNFHVKLIRNETNRGFAWACNRGAAACDHPYIVFLNSDTIVTRPGFARLIESLTASGTIAAAGPYTNYSGHNQQIAPTYTSLDTLELFAEDFARREAGDVDTDMLVGFCLAVKREVIAELNGAPGGFLCRNVFDERFGLGTFEDNDLCYRLRRAGYRLVISARSFIHHHGSKTLARMGNVEGLLRNNEQLYRAKWRNDLESGYASHLSGLPLSRSWERGLGGEGAAPPRIHFDPARHPDRRIKKVREKARRANISLCMIAKNEERVLGACLESAKPFFAEMIVVDTGSTDRTKEIAEEAGAKVFDFPWVEDFAAARNESLRHATGRWIFWLDADDTLPRSSGEAILDAALNAPHGVAGFIVPVRFVDEGASGTQVDHVKLFRRMPGMAFEGRIHEQILPALRAKGGEIARCGAVVLHSGYDTSQEGQEKKRKRDVRLLSLDYKERKDHPFVLFNLGMTQHFGQKHRSAVRWLRRCIRISPPTDSHVKKAYALLAVSLRELEQDDESLTVLEQGLAAFPNDPELHFHSGMTLARRGELQRARDHYRKALKADLASEFSSVDIGILGFKTMHNLAGVCWSLGDYKEAKSWWLKAIESAPEFTPSGFDLFNTALEVGDYPAASQALEAVVRAEGPSENAAKMCARYSEAVGGAENVETSLSQLVARYPDAVGPRLVLARHLLQHQREADAIQHLAPLANRGVAEAAYFLGVMAVQRGALADALSWMERATELNPDHDETRQQVAKLREALGMRSEGMSLEEAVVSIAPEVHADADELLAYAEEDVIGGYNAAGAGNGHPVWPGGSVWEVEGKMLYSLVRALKPQVVVEVGSFLGCSTSHLASACARNGSGKVYAVDPASDFSRVDPSLLPYIVPVREDVRNWTPPEQADFVFEDGTHEPGFTGAVLKQLLPFSHPGAVVVTHDYAHATHGPHVSAEFDEAVGAHALSLLIAPSNCGLGIAVCNRPEAAQAV